MSPERTGRSALETSRYILACKQPVNKKDPDILTWNEKENLHTEKDPSFPTHAVPIFSALSHNITVKVEK